MAKTKISEFNSNPALNTDIDSINISEGCAPSGINDAIRELMSQLKDFQTGAQGDSFNGPVGTTTAAAGAFTTVTTTSTINGLTVGKGAGAVATNTAVGASALAANTTGDATVAIGHQALIANTTGYNQVAVGKGALGTNTTGNNNVAVGNAALLSNTTASNNTAVGYQAGYSNTTGTYQVAIGDSAMYTNSTGTNNVAVGRAAMYANTTGSYNVAMGSAEGTNGYSALRFNTTGTYNTAIGSGALTFNTTASNNTAVGYQAGYTNSTGYGNVYIGDRAGQLNTTYQYNTFVGATAGQNANGGVFNSFFGAGAGYLVTTGAKNTIIGGYNGNQGGLDIRTASNYIVLSDGDGNPRGIFDGSGRLFLGGVTSGTYQLAVGGSGNVQLYKSTIGGYFQSYDGNISNNIDFGSYLSIMGSGSSSNALILSEGSSSRIYAIALNNGVYLNTSGTSWTSNSDERLKDIIEPISDAANKVCTLRAVIGKYKTDDDGVRRSFLIAQDVQAVLPEAVTVDDDEQQTLGVQYTEVIPLLVAAIKEQQETITQLKARLDAANL